MFFMVGQTGGNSLAFLYFFLYGSAGGSNAALWFFLAAFPVFFMWFCGCCVAGVCGCSSYGLRLGKKYATGYFFTFKVWLILKRLLSLYCIQKHISMYLTDREK